MFAAAISRLSQDNRSWSEAWMIGVALCAWLSWVLGTLAGLWLVSIPMAILGGISGDCLAALLSPLQEDCRE